MDSLYDLLCPSPVGGRGVLFCFRGFLCVFVVRVVLFTGVFRFDFSGFSGASGVLFPCKFGITFSALVSVSRAMGNGTGSWSKVGGHEGGLRNPWSTEGPMKHTRGGMRGGSGTHGARRDP